MTPPTLRRRPEITVVLPTFNRWPLLSRALASVLSQEDVEFEVIVVDDGSTDETQEQLAALEDPRLRVLRQEHNQGVARARNRGVAGARAEWVAFLDDDDFWAPRRLREHLDTADHSSASWVYGPVLVIDDEAALLAVGPARKPGDLQARLFKTNAVGGPSTVSVRTDLVRAVGCFDERLSVLADWDLWIRLNNTAPGAACPTPLVAYSEHSENMQLTEWSTIPAEFRYLARKHREAAESMKVAFGGENYMRWVAQNHRRAGRRFRAAAEYFKTGVRHRAPADVGRGLGLVFGERLMARVSRDRRPAPSAPEWVGAAHRARAGASATVTGAPTRNVAGDR